MKKESSIFSSNPTTHTWMPVDIEDESSQAFVIDNLPRRLLNYIRNHASIVEIVPQAYL